MGIKFTGIKNGKGCGCCGGGGCSITVNVDGCIPCPTDFTLTVKSGATVVWTGSVGAGTAGHEGTVIVDVGTAGTYDFCLDGPGYTAVCSSHAVTCGSTLNLTPTPNTTLSITVVLPAGFVFNGGSHTFTGTLTWNGSAWHVQKCDGGLTDPCWDFFFCNGLTVTGGGIPCGPPAETSFTCNPLDDEYVDNAGGTFPFCPPDGTTYVVTE